MHKKDLKEILVNSILKILLIFIFITNCSYNKNSTFWSNTKKIEKNVEKLPVINLFKAEEAFNTELNSNLKIKFSTNVFSKNSTNNQNHNGRINYSGNLENISRYKFSKIKYFDEFEPEVIFQDDNIIFFNSKGSILKFDSFSKLIWEKSYYSKSEKKLSPLLYMASNKSTLVVVDNISKFYALDINSGELLWSKNHNAGFISEVKIHNDKFFVMDSNNILRCFSLKDGSQIWEFQNVNKLIKSQKKLSIALIKNSIIFNNSTGDINAVDIDSGELIWVTPIASEVSLTEFFLLKMSDLVISNNTVFFSTNQNEFFSINADSGIINWEQTINSDLRPTIIGNLIFTVTLEGFLIIMNSETGDILRITDLFGKLSDKKSDWNVFTSKKMNPLYLFGNKKKKNEDTNKTKPIFEPVGFIVGIDNIYLTTDHGKLYIINIITGNIESILKIDNEKISRPFVSSNDLFLIKNNSIIKLN